MNLRGSMMHVSLCKGETVPHAVLFSFEYVEV